MSPSVTSQRDALGASALTVAPRLLGSHLTHSNEEGSVTIRITEVEAYMGSQDPGSHAFRGRTPRNAIMFGPAGYLYVYLSYGMHFCANVVCGPDGEAQAVLLRGGEVVEGQELARRRRPASRRDADLACGPARLAQALGITLEHYGKDLVAGAAPRQKATAETSDAPLGHSAGLVVLDLAPEDSRTALASGPRVGVSGLGGDGEVCPWRFWIPGDPTVSRYRPAVARNRTTLRN